jgi:hypothetical protein
MQRYYRRQLADRRFAELAADEIKAQLATTEQELAAIDHRIQVERGRFFESLRALSSGPPLGSRVREVELELAAEPLPEGIEVIELGGTTRAGAIVDAVLMVERDAFFVPYDGSVLRVGDLGTTIASLPALLGDARALQLARRVRDEIDPVLTELDDEITQTEEMFRVRIERLEAMQIDDATEFAKEQLAKIRSQITASIHAIMEHASVHLGSELAELGNSWISGVAASTSNDNLKQAITRIEGSATVSAQRIADETRLLVMGGAAGVAHDLYPELMSALVPHGFPEERLKGRRAAPALPAVEILPSLANQSGAKLSGAGQWLAGLFRAFEARRNDVREKAHARIEHLKEVATAELLDTEPRIHAAIEQTLNALLLAAIAEQSAWLETTLAAERESVAREGAVLAPKVRIRDRLREDMERLSAGIEAVEQKSPALAAAVGAAIVP